MRLPISKSDPNILARVAEWHSNQIEFLERQNVPATDPDIVRHQQIIEDIQHTLLTW